MLPQEVMDNRPRQGVVQSFEEIEHPLMRMASIRLTFSPA